MPKTKTKSTTKTPIIARHDDHTIIKKSQSLFAQEILPFLGIYQPVKAIGAPQNTALSAPDYTFLLEDDTYIHFGFQTIDNGAQDLRSYRTYEAQLSHDTNKDVTTYIIYTGNISQPTTTLETGISHYAVRKISMADYDAQQVLAELNRQIDAKEPLPMQSTMIISFIPTMSGDLTTQESLTQTIALTQKIQEPLIRHNTQSILYAFTNKFYPDTIPDTLKEEWKMTELGQQLYNDAAQQTTEKIAIALLDILNDTTIATKTGLTVTAIRKLRRQEKDKEKAKKETEKP